MDGQKLKQLNLLKYSKFRWGLFAGLWLLVMGLVVVPTWQGVVARHAEIKDLETRLATLDDWTVAGMWLAPSVKERTLPVNAAFSRFFPGQRGREDLFLSLGKVADQSQVENFTLSENSGLGMEGNDVWNDGSAMGSADAPPPTDGAPGAMDDGMSQETPKVELSTYRVSTQFFGDYERAAQFMDGLKGVERALKVHSLVIHPQKDGIQVKLELDVYVSKTSQS